MITENIPNIPFHMIVRDNKKSGFILSSFQGINNGFL